MAKINRAQSPFIVGVSCNFCQIYLLPPQFFVFCFLLSSGIELLNVSASRYDLESFEKGYYINGQMLGP